MNINNIELGDHVIVTYTHGIYKGQYDAFIWEKNKKGCYVLWNNKEDEGTTSFIAYKYMQHGTMQRRTAAQMMSIVALAVDNNDDDDDYIEEDKALQLKDQTEDTFVDDYSDVEVLDESDSNSGTKRKIITSTTTTTDGNSNKRLRQNFWNEKSNVSALHTTEDVDTLKKNLLILLNQLKEKVNSMQERINAVDCFTKELAKSCNSHHEKIYEILSDMKTTFSPKKTEELRL